MATVEKVESAIRRVLNGAATQYVLASGKTIRISNHGANPTRTDEYTVSIVIDNDSQSFRSDRHRLISNWERSNQFYMNKERIFKEQFDSIAAFLDWFDIE